MNFLWINFMASTIDDLFSAKGTSSREYREFTIDRALGIVSVQQEITREHGEVLFNQRRKWVSTFPGGSMSSLPLSSRFNLPDPTCLPQRKSYTPREFPVCGQRDAFSICAALVRKWTCTHGKSPRNSPIYSPTPGGRRKEKASLLIVWLSTARLRNISCFVRRS